MVCYLGFEAAKIVVFFGSLHFLTYDFNAKR